MSEDKKEAMLSGQEVKERLDNRVFVQRISDQELLINGSRYAVKENYNQALDIDQLNQRYSELFEKFDYIVGDIGYDQLRLRGFYYDGTKGVPLDMRISTLEDYLVEYCNFGTGYFVLERQDEKTVLPDYNRKDRLKNQGKKSSHQRRSHSNKNKSGKKTRKGSKKSFETKRVDGKKHPSAKKSKKEVKVKEVKNSSTNKSFQIKKKK